MKELIGQVKLKRSLQDIFKNLYRREFKDSSTYYIRENHDIIFIDIRHNVKQIGINYKFLEGRYGIVYNKYIHSQFNVLLKAYSNYTLVSMQGGKSIHFVGDELRLFY